MPEEKKEPQPGDIYELKHGPFRSQWTVVEVTDRGAVLTYKPQSVHFVGFDRPITAPDGTQLTFGYGQDFVGRAHFDTLTQTGRFLGHTPVE